MDLELEADGGGSALRMTLRKVQQSCKSLDGPMAIERRRHGGCSAGVVLCQIEHGFREIVNFWNEPIAVAYPIYEESLNFHVSWGPRQESRQHRKAGNEPMKTKG